MSCDESPIPPAHHGGKLAGGRLPGKGGIYYPAVRDFKLLIHAKPRHDRGRDWPTAKFSPEI